MLTRPLDPDLARHEVGLDLVAEHLDHICQLAGDARHAALGSDLDGGFGVDDCPHDLDTVADLQRIADRLRDRGYDAEGIRHIMGGNWLRFWTNCLPTPPP